MLKARLTCPFKAVKKDQVDADEGEEVTILSVKNGYVKVEKSNGEIGEIPNYFLEMVECPGETFADQIRYRRKWYSTVDSIHRQKHELDNPNEFLKELPKIPELANFVQVDRHQIEPLFTTKEPVIFQELEDLTIKLGDSIKLVCKFSSDDEVNVIWKRPNSKSGDIEIQTSENQSTFAKPYSTLSDMGQYIVIVENKHGKSSSLCMVTIIIPPGTPQNFTHEILPHHTIMLKWTSPTSGNSEFLWYTVEYRREDMDLFQKAIHGITQKAIKISELRPKKYLFRVYAFNEYFCGEPSEEVFIDVKKLFDRNLMDVSLD